MAGRQNEEMAGRQNECILVINMCVVEPERPNISVSILIIDLLNYIRVQTITDWQMHTYYRLAQLHQSSDYNWLTDAYLL